jgi:hypothetical protein
MRSDVAKASDRSDFQSSLDLLHEEDLRRTGFSSDGQAVLVDLERMFKALPPWALETAADREAQRLMDMARGTRSSRSSRVFAKALSDLDSMTKATEKPARVVSVDVHQPDRRAADIVAKSFDALQHDASLTPAARGEIMLRLSSIADKTFAKSDHGSDHLALCERAIALIDRARAEKHGDEADELFDKIKAAVRRGETEPGDLLALESRLHEIHRKLKEQAGHEKE